MKVLVTGSKGQLGYELGRTCPIDFDPIYTDVDTLDITNKQQVLELLSSHRPDAVINAAAYTAVDKAESDKELAFKINADAAGFLAEACQLNQTKLIHISTDFVFDGQSSAPYQPDSFASPLNIYGESKLQGEQRIQALLQNNHPAGFSIIRTSWVYSAHGNNFVKTMLRLMAERDELGIVSDQVGSPTWANNLAKLCWEQVSKPDIGGLYHYSDQTENNDGISWFDFAQAIHDMGNELGLLSKKVTIKKIKTTDYPTPAIRPAYSVMNTEKLHRESDLDFNNWRDSLKNMMEELAAQK